MNEQKQRIVDYWTKRSDSFAAQRVAELQDEIHRRWLAIIDEEVASIRKDNQGNPLKVLDVGTGTGFFAILLQENGYEVTGIDLTAAMIEHAKEIAASRNCNAQFQVMDAENPEFPDESFDVVISRNLTWTLPHAEHAYQEWMRILKKGGILLNFDANYGNSCFTRPEEELPADHAHHRIAMDLKEECQILKDEMSISKENRPAWDEKILKEIGCTNIKIDEEVYKKIYIKIDEFYNPDSIFSIRVIK